MPSSRRRFGAARDLFTRASGRVADHCFGVDTRALAAFRVALGTLVVADTLLRSRDLVAHYTDAGVLSRTALVAELPQPTLHLVSGSATGQAVLFCLTAGFGLALLLGYRTRVATLGAWLLVLSVQHRNPLILNGGDVLIRALLFWGLFLPLGERWSLDARRSRSSPRERVASVATAALLVQVVLVYAANAVLKLRGDLWLSGDAVLYVFSLDQFTVLLGNVLANYPALLRVASHGWLLALVVSPLLLVLPRRLRTGLALVFVGVHVGMALTMRLGLFPLISIAGLVPFLWGSSDGTRRFPMDRMPVSDRPSGGPLGDRLRSVLDPVASLGGRTLDLTDRVLPRITVVRPGMLERSDRDVDRLLRGVSSSVVAVVLVVVLVWNAAMLGYATVPDPVESGVETAGLDQRWNMFAPNPLRTDGWYVVPGTLENGSRVDAFHLSPVRWDRPDDVATAYPNARWRKYLVNLWRGYYAEYRGYFARYLCERWNDRHGTSLEQVTIYYVEQRSVLGTEPEPTERVNLGEFRCTAAPEPPIPPAGVPDGS